MSAHYKALTLVSSLATTGKHGSFILIGRSAAGNHEPVKQAAFLKKT